MTSVRTPASVCVACGYTMDATSAVQGDAAPCPGDVSLCLKCGEPMVFDHDLSRRMPTEQERLEINRDARVRRAQQLIRSPASREYWKSRSAGGAS